MKSDFHLRIVVQGFKDQQKLTKDFQIQKYEELQPLPTN